MRMAPKKTYGKTVSGVPITDELIEKLSKEAEEGFDVDEILRRRRGRPAMGSGPAKVESVRLDPELRQALAQRADRDHEATSSVIRRALREYLEIGEEALAAEGAGWAGDLGEIRAPEEIPDNDPR
jgi:predicted transcriptional regulator